MKNVTVLILAGGKSSRFWPLPNKLLLPFLGKPFLDHQLELIRSAGFKNIFVVGNSEIAELYASPYVTTLEQTGEGQGAAILSAEKHIAGRPVLIVNADDLVSPKLFKKLMGIKTQDKNILVGYKTERYFPGGYLVLDGQKIARVIEKPGEGKEPSSFVRLVCDYFADADILLSSLKTAKYKHTDTHYENALSQLMEQGEPFEMMEYEDTWIPIKYPWHTLTLMEAYLNSIRKSKISPNADIHKTVSISGKVIIESGVRIMEYAKLVGPLYIGKDTIIGNHTLVRASMIEDHSVIGFSSDVTRSYIGHNCWFHSNYVGDSVIAHDVGMGSGATLANLRLDEGDIYSVVQGKRVSSERSKLGAIIGNGARIAVGVYTMPGVKIGQNSALGAGVVAQEDVADNKKCYVKQTYTVVEHTISNVRDRERFRKKI